MPIVILLLVTPGSAAEAGATRSGQTECCDCPDGDRPLCEGLNHVDPSHSASG